MKTSGLIFIFILLALPLRLSAEGVIYRSGACEVRAANNIAMSLDFLEMQLEIRGLPSGRRDFIYDALCENLDGGLFTIQRHPQAPSDGISHTGHRDGANSIIIFAQHSGCNIEVEFWSSHGSFRREVSWPTGCIASLRDNNWSVTSQVPSGDGVGYFISCGNGRSVTVQYMPNLEPQAYVASASAAFSSLDQAARHQCNR